MEVWIHGEKGGAIYSAWAIRAMTQHFRSSAPSRTSRCYTTGSPFGYENILKVLETVSVSRSSWCLVAVNLQVLTESGHNMLSTLP
jgi:hypothetical protein